MIRAVLKSSAGSPLQRACDGKRIPRSVNQTSAKTARVKRKPRLLSRPFRLVSPDQPSHFPRTEKSSQEEQVISGSRAEQPNRRGKESKFLCSLEIHCPKRGAAPPLVSWACLLENQRCSLWLVGGQLSNWIAGLEQSNLLSLAGLEEKLDPIARIWIPNRGGHSLSHSQNPTLSETQHRRISLATRCLTSRSGSFLVLPGIRFVKQLGGTSLPCPHLCSTIWGTLGALGKRSAPLNLWYRRLDQI